MKKYTLLFVVLFMATISQAQIKWMSIEQATAAQQKEPRPIIIDMYTLWCGPCKMLEKNTFKNKDVAAYINKHYYAVKFNAEGNASVSFKGNTYTNPGYKPEHKNRRNASHQFAQYMGVRAYPTLVFMDEKGDLLAPIPGYKTPEQLELYLKLFEKDAYKSIKTKEDFERYQRNFKPSFKG